MKLVIIANRRRTCNWVGELLRRMERRFGAANVALELVDGSDLPGATRLLLAFEKLVFRLRADGLGAPMLVHVRADTAVYRRGRPRHRRERPRAGIAPGCAADFDGLAERHGG